MSLRSNSPSKDLCDLKTNRRRFIKSIALAGSSLIAFSMFRPNLLNAQISQENDPKLIIENIQYKGESGQVLAYMARPKVEGRFPAVIVIHENRGLQPHIKDVTRRFALEGFVAIAVKLIRVRY